MSIILNSHVNNLKYSCQSSFFCNVHIKIFLNIHVSNLKYSIMSIILDIHVNNLYKILMQTFYNSIPQTESRNKRFGFKSEKCLL